jgi:catechol 2,3-dioxygenase
MATPQISSGSMLLGIHPPVFKLPAATRIGRVRLAVSSLGRSLAFYGGLIGLSVLERSAQFAQLGAGGRILLELEEQPGLIPLGRSPRLGCIGI